MQRLASILRRNGPTVLSLAVLIIMIVGAVGILCATGPGGRQTITAQDKKRLAVVTPASVNITAAAPVTRPVRMLLPSIDTGLDVADATVDTKLNVWPLSDAAAQYANFTPGLGSKKGTMLLYGHNSWPVLRKSNDLRLGDELVLVDQADQQWRFRLSEVRNVTPDQVGFIYEDTPFRVVVFTCNGWNDEYRRLMYFEPVR